MKKGNPFLDRLSTRKMTSHGNLAEVNLAKRMGARLTPASGAKDGAKGDMSVGEFLIESKATKTGTMAIKRDWLLKINAEAVQTNKRPALVIQFVGDAGEPIKNGSWVMMNEDDFKDLISR